MLTSPLPTNIVANGLLPITLRQLLLSTHDLVLAASAANALLPMNGLPTTFYHPIDAAYCERLTTHELLLTARCPRLAVYNFLRVMAPAHPWVMNPNQIWAPMGTPPSLGDESQPTIPG
jgi:hypothetical protein